MAAPVFECTRARIVLEDCRHALALLRTDPAGVNWRILWVAAHSLLRAVRDALGEDKRAHDAPPELVAEIQAIFDTKIGKKAQELPEAPAIYWHFIKEGADGILHGYKFSALQTLSYPDDDGEPTQVDVSAQPSWPAGTLPPWSGKPLTRTYEMKVGPFRGRDPRELVAEAIEWWEDVLSEAETRAAAAALGQRLGPDDDAAAEP